LGVVTSTAAYRACAWTAPKAVAATSSAVSSVPVNVICARQSEPETGKSKAIRMFLFPGLAVLQEALY